MPRRKYRNKYIRSPQALQFGRRAAVTAYRCTGNYDLEAVSIRKRRKKPLIPSTAIPTKAKRKEEKREKKGKKERRKTKQRKENKKELEGKKKIYIYKKINIREREKTNK